MQFIGSHAPPARESGFRHEIRHQIFPDQRLDIFRNNEILLDLRQHVRQVGQRPRQIRATAGCFVRGRTRVAVCQDCRPARNRLAREIVRSHKDGVVVQHLSPRRLVVGVVQAYQRVP